MLLWSLRISPRARTNENVIVHVAEDEQEHGGSPATTEADCEGLIIIECVEDKNGFRGFDRFKIQFNGIWHVFEISLFSLSHDDHNNTTGIPGQHLGSRSNHYRHYNHQKFKENRLTFEDFSSEKDLLDDETNFIVRYNQKYTLTWENASTALTSLGICRKSIINLSQTQLDKVVCSATRNDTAANGSSSGTLDGSKSTEADPLGSVTSSSSPQPAASYRRPWTRWWYKTDGLSPAGPNHQRLSSAASVDTWSQDKPIRSSSTNEATSNKVSPPTSPPDSPRSLPGTTHGEYVSEEKVTSTGDESNNPPIPTPHLKTTWTEKGVNQVTFSVQSSYSGYAVCTSRIFLWEADHKICISDIDGTITKSDALGHVFNMIGRDWTHAGVAKLYTDIARNGYKLIYLTSRAIGQANTTREYLKGINQMGLFYRKDQ
ncbi:hypothetical protein KEM48_006754 [Puccinia striiformis f. sp. tritici PST-130]|nr:hypothetical protein KEM48_006754 [Puccinia striiformis f. sp. tritici PST-130]